MQYRYLCPFLRSQISCTGEPSLTPLHCLFRRTPVVGESVLRCLRQTCESIEEALEISKGSIESFSVSAVQQSNPLKGRPKFDIKRDQLCYFADMCFTVASMADMLGVSTRTIEGRLHA